MRQSNLEWFTLDWAKRWGLPIGALAIGVGMSIGALQYKLSTPQTVTASIPSVVTATTTATIASVPDTRIISTTVAGAPETRRETVTLTQTPRPDVETVTKTVGSTPEPETETVTVTKTEQPVVEVGNRGNGQDRGN